MAENRVSIVISPQDRTTINGALGTIKTTLFPYLISLSPEERQNLPKMKDRTIAFVNKTLGYAASNPEFLPPYLDVPELQKDIDAVNILNSFLVPLEQLLSGVDDTMMEAGSEAYVAALSYYNSVKQASKTNVKNAKTIYEDLKERSPQKSGTPVAEPVA